MTEPLKVELDGSQLVRGAKEVQSALEALKAVVQALDKTPVNELKGRMAELTASFNTIGREMSGVMSEFVKNAEKAAKEVDAAITKGVKEGVKHAQEEAKKEAIKIGTRVDPIAFQDGTKVNLGTSGLKNTQELLAKQAEVLAMPGAINPAVKARQQDELRDLERWGKERAAAEAKAAKEAAAARAAFEKDAAEVLKAMSLGLEADRLRDLERAGRERAAQEAKAAAEAAKARAAAEKEAAALLKKQMDGLEADRLRDLEVAGKARAAALLAQAAEEQRIRMGIVAAQARVGFNRAAAEASGPFSMITGVKAGLEVNPAAKLAPAVKEVTSSLEDLSKKVTRTPEEMARAKFAMSELSSGSRDLHSSIRGLASGFGAMWLTWGSVLPLMAGAAVSGAIVQTVKMGAQVNDTMERLRVLGDTTAESVAGLNAQMLELARTGPFGPKEIAEAMKTLKLAGMDVVDVSKTIKDVLNFSIAGDVGIQAAADALTTVKTAFGISSDGFGYIADTISKAAAESKSSVEDMSNAFKTASVINQQYGVSLEDTAVGLALLANAGIKGTSAGTALRNTYAELSGRTKHAADALKKLGVEALDPVTGKMKETGVVFRQLMEALQTQNTPIGAMKVLQQIFDERGAKEAFAIFDALSRKAKDTGQSVGTVYDQLLAKVTNAAGFAAIAAAEVALTPMNQMKAVASTLQSTLVEAFDQAQPYLLEISVRLREAFGSDQFKSMVQSLITVVGGLTAFVVEHGRAIATMLLVYTGWRGATLLVTAASTAFGILGGSATAAAAGVTTLGVAARMATAANPLLLTLAGLVTAAGAAWATYQMWVGKANNTHSEGFSTTQQLLKNLRDEADRLDRINEAREKGLTLQELELQAKGKVTVSGNAKAVSEAEARYAAAKKEADLMASRDRSSLPSQAREIAEGRVRRELIESEMALNLARAKQDGELREVASAKEQVWLKSYRNTQAERKALDEATKARGAKFTGKDNGEVPEGSASNMKVLQDNELQMIMKRYRSSMSVISDGEAAQQRMIQAARASTLYTEGEFYARELMLAEGAENTKLSRNKEFREEYMAGYLKLVGEVEDAFRKAEKENVGKKNAAEMSKKNKEARDNQLENLKRKLIEDLQEVDDSDAKIKQAAETRMKLQAIAQAGAYEKMKKASRDFWESEALLQERQARETEVEDRTRLASPENAARIRAAAAETDRWNGILNDHDKAIRDAEKSLEKYREVISANGPPTEEQAALEWDLTAALIAQRTEREKIASQVPKRVAERGESAALKQIKDDRAELTKNVADAITTGLLEGGAAGGKKLRDVLKNELRKKINLQVTAVVDTVFNSIFGPAGGGASGGLGGLGGLLSTMFGLGGGNNPIKTPNPVISLSPEVFLPFVPSFDVGTDFVPKDMLAMIHKGEKITPAAYNKPGADSQRPIVVNQNFTVGDVATGAMVQRAVANSEKRIAASIGRSVSRGGVLA